MELREGATGMVVPTGYIRIWRSIENSHVFHDSWLLHLWLWCLLRANYQEQKFLGNVIPAGSFVTCRERAAEALGTSPSRIYRGLARLESLGMISRKSNSNFTVVTICNWGTYQSDEPLERTTSGQQADNERTTSGQDRKRKKGKKEKTSESGGFRKPTVDQVAAYCLERRNGIDPEAFVNHYEARGWMAGKSKIKDWKRAVITWEIKRKGERTEAVEEQALCRVPTDEELAEWTP